MRPLAVLVVVLASFGVACGPKGTAPSATAVAPVQRVPAPTDPEIEAVRLLMARRPEGALSVLGGAARPVTSEPGNQQAALVIAALCAARRDRDALTHAAEIGRAECERYTREAERMAPEASPIVTIFSLDEGLLARNDASACGERAMEAYTRHGCYPAPALDQNTLP